jgi:hypothetical protein
LGWIDLFRTLGGSLLEVFWAELDALKEDLARSGRQLARAVALLAAAFFVLFWTLGAVVFTAGAVLAIWLQPWAAALIVTGVFLAAAALLAWLGMRRLSRIENPLDSVRERLDDHLDWWQHNLLAERGPVDLPPAGGYRRPPVSPAAREEIS